MLGGDWTEHEMTGCDVDRVFIGNNSRVTVRSHYPLARPHAVPGVRGSNVARLQRV